MGSNTTVVKIAPAKQKHGAAKLRRIGNLHARTVGMSLSVPYKHTLTEQHVDSPCLPIIGRWLSFGANGKY
jgi:hypothetical protein